MGSVRKLMRQQQKQMVAQGVRPIQEFNAQKFGEQILEQAKAICRSEMVHLEQELAKLRREYDVAKANIITVNELLKQRNVYNEKHYNEMYQKVFQSVVGLQDDMGRMPGKTAINLYNF